MKYYVDFEFDGTSGPIISMGLIREDDEEFYILVSQSLTNGFDPWVREHVIPRINHHQSQNVHTVMYQEQIGAILRHFMHDDPYPVIIADSPVDIARFAWVLTVDEKHRWVSNHHKRISFEVFNVDCYPTHLKGMVRHNAWCDAKALKYHIDTEYDFDAIRRDNIVPR